MSGTDAGTPAPLTPAENEKLRQPDELCDALVATMNDWMRRTPGAGLHAAIVALLETIRLAVIQAPPDVQDQMLAHCLRALQHTR